MPTNFLCSLGPTVVLGSGAEANLEEEVAASTWKFEGQEAEQVLTLWNPREDLSLQPYETLLFCCAGEHHVMLEHFLLTR